MMAVAGRDRHQHHRHEGTAEYQERHVAYVDCVKDNDFED